ncbi:MAG: amino acid adenylation domain-containing protein [Gemmatimonadaceae bacterium]|nr:amino acid adenylation domain-containing protein [Gemmatimonadaceae bacterium]
MNLDVTDYRSLRSGFLRSSRANPGDPALFVAGVTRTYEEIEQTARLWSGAMLQSAGRPLQRVGILASRSEVAYAGTLAALFSGATFVPLNKRFPVERNRAMARRAELDAIIVDRTSASQLEGILQGWDSPPIVLSPDQGVADEMPYATVIDKAALSSATPATLLPPVLSDDIAYLLFTSGTTGEPKGVGVTHANVLHFIDVMSQRFQFKRTDRFSQTFDQTFDLAVFDLFMAWEAGACVYAMQPVDLLAPARFVTKQGLTVWFSVPSVPALMRKSGLLRADSMPTLRWSLFCGEPLPAATAEAWQEAAPNSMVENLYGPTELTIACCTYRWHPASSRSECVNDVVPIGRPFPGLGAIVVDDALQPVTNGEPGELCVCGPQTAPGYWRDPEKTAEKFVELPVDATRTKRFYRTGDRVVRSAQGVYAYLGRADNQVKVSGYRVELAEVEAVMLRDTGVTSAVALGWPIEAGSAKGIVAFACGDKVDAARLTARLRESLPPYMVPSEIHELEQLPLNANGKIDRGALALLLEAAAIAVGPR